MKNLSKLELIEKVAQLESQISLLKTASSHTTEVTGNTTLTENALKEFVSQLPLAAALFSPNGSVLEMNRKLIALLGYTIDDIPSVEVHWPLFFPDPVYRQKVQDDWTEMLTQSAKTGIPIQPMLLDITDKNGNVKKLEVHSLQFGVHAITMWVDFTENLKREEELIKAKEKAEESERKFRTLFETIPIGITLANENGQIISSNPAAEKILGLTKEAQLQRSIDGVEWSIIRPDGTVMPPEEYASTRALKEQQPIFNIEMGITKEINKVAWINVYAAPIKDYGVVISYEDVTERKQAEQAIRKSEENFKNLFENNPNVLFEEDLSEIVELIAIQQKETNTDLAVYLDRNPDFVQQCAKAIKIINVNKAGIELFGFDTKEELIQNIFSIFNEKSVETFKKMIIGLANGQKQFSEETEYVTKAGERLYVVTEFKQLSDFKSIIFSIIDITERKQIEQAFVENATRFKDMVENLPIAYQSLDEKGVFVDVNQDWLELLNYSREDIIGKKFGDFWTPETKHIFPKRFNTFKQQCFLNNEEISLLNKNGETVTVILTGRIQLNQQGRFEKTHCIIVDITERKQAEQALKESEDKFRTVFNMLPDFLCVADLATATFKMVNPAFTEVLGYSQEELVSKPYTAFIHPDDVTKTQEKTKNELISGKSVFNFKNRYQCTDGSYRWLKWRSHIIPEKGIAYGAANDITLQMQAEELLAKQTEQLRLLSTELETIIDNIPGLVFYKDTNNRFIRVNKFMCDAHKMSKDELEGVSLFDIYPKEMAQAYFDDDLKVIESKKPTLNIDEPWETETGLQWINTSKIPNMDKDGNVVGIIGISTDVTERKKQENIIKQQNEDLTKLNADKDRFMRILAHDLRSPFNSLLGLLDFLEENIRNYDMNEVEKLLNLTNKSAQSTFALLEDLLLWSHSQSGKLPFEPQILSFSTICNEVIEKLQLTANTKNITINYVASDSISIFADKNMLRTILRNLISNAIKFTHSKGEIHIYVEIKNKSVIVTVSDTGIGMAKEDQAKLFDFTNPITTKGTANEKGTGLGLLLCKEFVEKHDGKIWIESEVGEGSNFKFTLPLNS